MGKRNPLDIEIKLASKLLKVSQNALIGYLGSKNHTINNGLVDVRIINNIAKNSELNYNFSRIHIREHENRNSQLSMHEANSLKAIDLFCGAGGTSCGFKMAGFHVVGAIDNNKKAAQTHALNFPETETVCDDIESFSPSKMEALVGRNVDLIVGSPPCQTFSSLSQGKIRSLGRSVKTDIRNYYYKVYIDYIKHFKPKIFVLENVPGFKTKYGGELFKEFLHSLEHDSGVAYKLGYGFLESQRYGVPQTRKRLFVLGCKKGYSVNFPPPPISDKVNVTVSEAISDLPVITDDWRLDEMPYSKYRNLSEYARLLRNGTKTVKNNICRISNESAKEMFKYLEPGQRFIDLPPETVDMLAFIKPFKSKIIANRARRLPKDKPSWTVIAHIGMDGYEYIHPAENRTLSVREAARLQSFPDNFIFTGNMREQYVQVGNSVPPLLAKAIAEQIRNALLK